MVPNIWYTPFIPKKPHKGETMLKLIIGLGVLVIAGLALYTFYKRRQHDRMLDSILDDYILALVTDNIAGLDQAERALNDLGYDIETQTRFER